MQKINDKLINWASEIDEGTILQASKTARMDIVSGHVALMPDAHVGIGATVGSVIPTKDAIIPSAVGVDIGCGMIAIETDLFSKHLPDDLDDFLLELEQRIPAGVGKGHNNKYSPQAQKWLSFNRPNTALSDKQAKTALDQFGTLGSGNHFFEVCLDTDDRVWIVLHSGSRGIGNQLANMHMKEAKRLCNELERSLEEKDLAYFLQSDPQFNAYIADMLWAQDYALANREQMMDAGSHAFFTFVRMGKEVNRINCHHNFTQKETHNGEELWITRKGAIKAETGDLGIIPGSMGTRSYIVKGKSNPLSYNSCSHGAGRRHSRTKAKELFTVDDLAKQMDGKIWLKNKAKFLLDEIPSCYKDIDQVMDDQEDLVEILVTLRQIINYKGA